MFSCKNMMMIDVFVVCSLHSMVIFCRFGFFDVVVRSCGSTAVLYSVSLYGWTSGSYNTWLLVICMFHAVAFFQKGLFLAVDWECRFTDECKSLNFHIVCWWSQDVICYCLCWYFQVHIFYDYSTFVLFAEWYGARASWIYFSNVFL